MTVGATLVRLNLVLAESALELIPQEIVNSPEVRSDSRRRGVQPSRILLDRGFHQTAVTRLSQAEKSGRPDLVHAAILSATGTPLYLDGGVKLYVHTCSDVVLDISPKTRIPKGYARFRGLVEKALAERPAAGLVRVYPSNLLHLLKAVIKADLVIGLSTQGSLMNARELAQLAVGSKNPCFVVGGFARGHFSPQTVKLFDRLVRIHATPMEAHVVVARIIYEVENSLAAANR